MPGANGASGRPSGKRTAGAASPGTAGASSPPGTAAAPSPPAAAQRALEVRGDAEQKQQQRAEQPCPAPHGRLPWLAVVGGQTGDPSSRSSSLWGGCALFVWDGGRGEGREEPKRWLASRLQGRQAGAGKPWLAATFGRSGGAPVNSGGSC